MYAAIRPAIRSIPTARAPARFIRRRRYPLPHRALFHSSRRLAQAPSTGPPNTPGEDPIKGSDSKETKSDNAAKEHSATTTVSEDLEDLTQKLQVSKQQARRYSSALRRSQRRNRSQGLPPIHIPKWFLEHRVRLHNDVPSQSRASQQSLYALLLSNTESGDRVALPIPLTTYSACFASITDLFKASWNVDLSKEHRRSLAQDFARRLGRENDAELLQALEEGKEPDSVNDIAEAAQRKPIYSDVEPAGRIDEPEAISKDLGNIRAAITQGTNDAGDSADLAPSDRGNELSPLLLAEIRSSIAASLSVLQPSTSDTFPASKTNLILYSPVTALESSLNQIVFAAAAEFGADVITLEAQDLAQIAGDYLGEGLEPSPNTIRSLGYDTYGLSSNLDEAISEFSEQDPDAEAEAQDGFPDDFKLAIPFVSVSSHGDTRKLIHLLANSPLRLPSSQADGDATAVRRNHFNNDDQVDNLKLSTLLEALVDSSESKREEASQTIGSESGETRPAKALEALRISEHQEKPFFNYSFARAGTELDFTDALPSVAKDQYKLVLNTESVKARVKFPSRPRIIFVPDIKALSATQHGSRIIQILQDLVRKQRKAGESVMLVGTTCSMDFCPDPSPAGMLALQSESNEGFFRTIVALPKDKSSIGQSASPAKPLRHGRKLSEADMKIQAVNLRHIHNMLQVLDPAACANLTNPVEPSAFAQSSSVFPESCSQSVLSYDQVHRLALTARGLHAFDAKISGLTWSHVALASGLLEASDAVKSAFAKMMQTGRPAISARQGGIMSSVFAALDNARKRHGRTSRTTDSPKSPHQEKLQLIKAKANEHEKNLIGGIIDPDQMKTGFDNIHVPAETIEAIRTLTSMAMLRPDAFTYGVLATEKVSGALLYGPPGTGKTLLAKAVAKESGAHMLEVSGSQIMDKYVGEGEKNVEAIFSLARKVSPCIVFLDEADAIFGTRDAGKDFPSRRGTLNQFLKEWDGLKDTTVFVMVATNRPFDLDDAVIRRLPRRLLVDLPTHEDRKKILQIHLRGEQLHESVDLDDLAKRTPLYSGSDLKNVVVFAALACVREENEQAALAAIKAATTEVTAEPDSANSASSDAMSSSKSMDKKPSSPILVPGQTYEFPERRTLHLKHFEKAMQEVSASISEDMRSLRDIKKFDEQYGDRRQRKKKKTYGFGTSVQDTNEEAARVRT